MIRSHKTAIVFLTECALLTGLLSGMSLMKDIHIALYFTAFFIFLMAVVTFIALVAEIIEDMDSTSEQTEFKINK